MNGAAVQAIFFVAADVVAKLVPPAALPIGAAELAIQELEKLGFIRLAPSDAEVAKMREVQAHIAADIAGALASARANHRT